MKFNFYFAPGDDDESARRAAEAAAAAREAPSGMYAERNGGIVRLAGDGGRAMVLHREYPRRVLASLRVLLTTP